MEGLEDVFKDHCILQDKRLEEWIFLNSLKSNTCSAWKRWDAESTKAALVSRLA
jgi:hypothetical protein